MSLAELHDVPDDKEVSGKAEPCDQRKLMLDLLLRPFEQTRIAFRPIAPNDTLVHALAQKAVHRFAIRHGIAGKLIAEIAQLKVQPRGKFYGVLNRSVNIAEERRHFLCGTEMALAVERQKAARTIQLRVVPNRSKEVKNLTVIRGGVPHSVGRKQREIQ